LRGSSVAPACLGIAAKITKPASTATKQMSTGFWSMEDLNALASADKTVIETKRG
jgi:hypothetical protein